MKITKSFATLFAIGMIAFAPSANAQEKKEKEKEELKFTVIKEAPITSVKNQSRSGTCWCFSSAISSLKYCARLERHMTSASHLSFITQ